MLLWENFILLKEDIYLFGILMYLEKEKKRKRLKIKEYLFKILMCWNYYFFGKLFLFICLIYLFVKYYFFI